MKVNFDLLKKEEIKTATPISFEGYKFEKSNNGNREFVVTYPHDSNAEKCYLEIYKLDKDGYENYFSTGKAFSKTHHDLYPLEPGQNKINLTKEFGIGDNEAFAYHYILKDKNGQIYTRVDVGDIIDERSNYNEYRNIFNIVTPNKSNVSRGGSMKLVIIDSQNVGYKYNDKNEIIKSNTLVERGRKAVKTIANKMGGTLAGLEKDVKEGKYDNYGRIISLPMFTDDDFSAHAYWNKNCYQMAHTLGNINNYASLQKAMFTKGLNLVSDGAFVNEGLHGIHFNHVLKWAEESPFYRWFRATSIQDGPLALGVFAKNQKYISHKIVNSPYKYEMEYPAQIKIRTNEKYDATKPTYIQYFDTRLVTEEEKKDTTSLIKVYSKTNSDNVYELHSHNDSIFPWYFEINPESYNRNIKDINYYNSTHKNKPINLASPLAARIMSKNKNFSVDGKIDNGFETWDANSDIAKLNFTFSNTDEKALFNLTPEQAKIEVEETLRGNAQVQDYAVDAGIFWTRKTDDILRLHIAQTIKDIDPGNPKKTYNNIIDKADNKTLPKLLKGKISEREIQNILRNRYINKRNFENLSKNDLILKELMNTPPESFEFGDNIVQVLAFPMISKRANNKDEIGKTRFELFKQGNKNLPKEYAKTYNKMESIYQNELAKLASTLLEELNTSLPTNKKLFVDNNVTEYGNYVLPLLLPEFAKFSFVKALAPQTNINIDKNTGEIAYDYNKLKNTHWQTLGLPKPSDPEDEALLLLNRLQKGIKNITQEDLNQITKSFSKILETTSLESLKIADLIIDKTQSGLDWRIDATKDIADIEALYNNDNRFDQTWQDVTNFWKKFVQGIYSINPNSYTVAEITDEGKLYDKGLGYASDKYKNTQEIVKKFERETGMTATANYSHFFNSIYTLFARGHEDGFYETTNPKYLEEKLFNTLVDGEGAFIRSGDLQSLMYAYTFIGNHDKPRALHCAAIDMTLFYADLNNRNNYQHRLNAYKIVNDKMLDDINPYEVNNYDFSAVSPKAVAMGYAIRTGLIKTLEEYKANSQLNDEQFNRAFTAISKAVTDLVNGKYKNAQFNPDSFGVKPIDVNIEKTLEVAKKEYKLQLPKECDQNIENDAFKKILDPAISKLLGMMKYLVALPGIPTLFDGDETGATGYDTKTKNMFLQGRQRVHEEWVDDLNNNPYYKKFIAEHKKEIDEVMALRAKPELDPLNNGSIYVLPKQNGVDAHNDQIKYTVPAVLRQNTDGGMTISLFNTSGFHPDNEKYYSPNTLKLESIFLNFGVNERKEKRRNEHGQEYETTIHETYIADGDKAVGIRGLKPNTVFVNAKDPSDLYYVNKTDDKYYIKRATDDGKITINDSTLILYSKEGSEAQQKGQEGNKSKNVAFTGTINYEIPHVFVSDAYRVKKESLGKQLALYK